MNKKKIEEILRQERTEFARKGAVALNSRLTPAQRTRRARKAAKARWGRVSTEERSRIAKQRWVLRRAKAAAGA